jgi:hypothetical protein
MAPERLYIPDASRYQDDTERRLGAVEVGVGARHGRAQIISF